ncbi:unnamed protein product [Rotaria sordida]|uniref:Uncharacterized protein n=1 Tax=Rotaria sordida TaxID=392033 RepID=A0A814EJI3_9BILA|nr:unnamed protein product [Rotaria sordida]
MGEDAATSIVIDELVITLQDQHPDVRAGACLALAQMGTKAATTVVIDQLVAMLQDPYVDVRRSACSALASMGENAAASIVIDKLVITLQDQHPDVRADACQALERMGRAAAITVVIDRLVTMLQDPYVDVRQSACRALGSMGEDAATSIVIDELVITLQDQHPDVRAEACIALAQMGRKAATTVVIDQLVTMLQDPYVDVRQSACRALASMGENAATSIVIDELVITLRDEHPNVRADACQALERMGRAAAITVVIDRLVTMLQDSYVHVRQSACTALASMGENAATNAVNDEHVIRLQDENPDVRADACQTLERMGRTAATTVVIDRLVTMLQDPYVDVRQSACRALASMGENAATNAVIDELVTTLLDQDSNVRADACLALVQMNIDLEYDVLFSQQQKKKRYNTNNSNARAKKITAERNDELLCLSQKKSTDKYFLDSLLYDNVQRCELITSQENNNIRFSLHDNVDLALNENNIMYINDTVQVSNYNDDDDNNDDYNNDDYNSDDDNNDDYNSDDNNNDDADTVGFIDELSCDNEYEDLFIEQPQLLHRFTSIPTKSYCIELLKLFRAANICKSHSKRLISLIQSILPVPNNFPSTFEDLLSLLNIEDLFFKRSVCLICKTDLHFNEKKCSRCQVSDEKMKADIYDVDIKKVLTCMLKRLSPDIEKYKQKIKNNIDDNGIKDIPFARLYRTLLEKYDRDNIISLILHLDGIALTRSTRLKMWLFSGAMVELPSILRYRRYNMALLSIWVGFVEPDPDLWLRYIVSELNHMKTQDIYINEHLVYKLKIYSVTGDCPALRLALNFIGHGGYFCCWYCYIEGEHIGTKRQYKYEQSMILRRSSAYFQESLLAHNNKKNVFGHLGVTVLQPILDIALPNSIMVDYLHISLLGHAKALILDLYRCIKPSERTELDTKLYEQRFPHYFNRKMRKIENFAYVKANEIKNILFYGLLPNFQLYLPIDKLAHVALYVCFIRLLHGQPILGPETCDIADELFQKFYYYHDDYFNGLQNLVLHLHVHLTTIYKNHGALSNIGCFGQEDLIGEIGSNHHGTRYYGELITFYYNIDFSIHDKSSTPPSTNNQLYDQVLDSLDQYNYIHERLCDCKQVRDCFSVYRRLIPTLLFQSLMDTVLHRSERSKKPKQIYSPSNPLQPYYYLVTYDYPEKYRVVGRTSIQKITNDKAVLSDVDGEVRIITSGTFDYCQRELKLKMQKFQLENSDVENDDDYDNGDNENGDDGRPLHSNGLSESILKRPADGFSTPALKRSNKQNNYQYRTLNRSLERNKQIKSVIHVSHDHSDGRQMPHSRQEKVSGEATRFGRMLQTTNDGSNINTDDADSSFDNPHFENVVVKGIRSLKKQVSKLTKTVDNLAMPSSPSSKYDSLEFYRNENESENFSTEVMWNQTNLLNIVGRDPGDYGRRLLRLLYTEAELQSSLLPSQSAHPYQKDILDQERFKILNEAIRIKYRLSHDGYRRYYTNTLRIKLSRCLYDSGSRKIKKATQEKRTPHHQQHIQPPAASTIELFEESNLPITTTRNNLSYSDKE